MDYMRVIAVFNIDQFVKQQTGKDILEVIDNANQQAKIAENYRHPKGATYKNDVESVRRDYMFAMKGFSFFLQTRMKPSGVPQETLVKFKPVIESLVQSQQLPNEALQHFGGN